MLFKPREYCIVKQLIFFFFLWLSCLCNRNGCSYKYLLGLFRYIKLSDLVDQMFPPFKTEPSGLIAPDQFSSFTYWRAPLPNITLDDIDLTSDVKMEAATP